MWVADLANLPSVRSSVQNPIAHELCVYFVYAQPLSLSRIWNQTYPQKHGPTLHYLHFEREGEFLFSPESSTGNEVELLPVTHSPDTLSFHIERVNDAVSQTRTEPHHWTSESCEVQKKVFSKEEMQLGLATTSNFAYHSIQATSQAKWPSQPAIQGLFLDLIKPGVAIRANFGTSSSPWVFPIYPRWSRPFRRALPWAAVYPMTMTASIISISWGRMDRVLCEG